VSRKADKPIYLVREGARLLPASQMDEEFICELPAGKQLAALIRRPGKSLQELRLFWALLHKALEARPDPRWPTPRRLADTLLLQTRRHRIVVSFDGQIHTAPQSIAAMGHDEFHSFFEDAKPLLREHVLGCDEESFRRFLADVADVLGIEEHDITGERERNHAEP